jgi:bifunctional DNA-binding transcriptional regulator/antitoxin component of YhaV-PrlF toxin-antitoxin module
MTTETFRSSVSPKGQITLPLVVRKRWRLKAKDRVSITVEGDAVRIAPAHSPVDESYGVLPPLARPLTVEEMTEIAAEEHARETVRD